MRNFRKAAVAAATALTVGMAGTTVASAQSSVTQLGQDWGAYTVEDGQAVVKDENQVTGAELWGTETADDVPEWASKWKTATIIGAVASGIGGVIAAYNYAVYNNIIPQHFLDPIFRR
ncbi:hypothetical protein H0194_01520 [Corynebacterium incognita]|uniref:Or membrane protein n=1 Tax=Corynebacterium incognita TaxID=2754725 RepID=A0A7G7CQ97_9CORY|nr:hypothetical protein [Corynebacterium incognita]QNE89763.1 hypothetical protein H0194_01520 [Corynebacterium incognita]